MLSSVLKVMAPILLAEHKLNPLLALCQDLNVSLADEVLRFFYAATARILALHAGGLDAPGAKTIPRPITDALKAWPVPKKSEKLLEILSRDAASVAAELFGLLSPHATTNEIADALATTIGTEQSDLFAVLAESIETSPADPDLVSPAYRAAEILQALRFLRAAYPEASAAEIAMNSLTALFASLHAAFVSSERSRLVKAIALVVSTSRQISLLDLADAAQRVNILPQGGRCRRSGPCYCKVDHEQSCRRQEDLAGDRQPSPATRGCAGDCSGRLEGIV